MRVRRIAHRGLRRFYEHDAVQGLNPATTDKLRKMLSFLEAMTSPEELRTLPAWKAHVLGGRRRGTWSLHVTRNWRLTFRVVDDEIVDLDLEDYH